MNIFIYSGSIDGLFSVIYDIYTTKTTPYIITIDHNIQYCLNSEIINITDDLSKSEHIKMCIKKCSNEVILNKIETAFLSNEINKEIIIFNYIRMIFKNKEEITKYKENINIIKFDEMYSKVVKEAHIIKGFLRFKELSNSIYYAEYTPDNNITGYIFDFFVNKFNNMQFIIHDTKRNIIGMYNGNEKIILKKKIKFNNIYTENEIKIQQLWNEYYEHASIKSRRNIKQQLNYLPKRYWCNMSEMKNSLLADYLK